MTGHTAQDRFNLGLHRDAFALVRKFIKDVEQHRFRVHFPQNRRCFAYGNRAAAKTLDAKAEPLQLFRDLHQSRTIAIG